MKAETEDTWMAMLAVAAVVESGSLSAAARHLDLHNTTVMRRVQRLEDQLGQKLFLRSAARYVPTEAALKLARITQDAAAAYRSEIAKLTALDPDISGRVVISFVPEVADLVFDVLPTIMERHPRLSLDVRSERLKTRLEYGEAHIAVRAGPRPEEPDFVVLPWRRLELGLYRRADCTLDRLVIAGPQSVPALRPDILERVGPSIVEHRVDDANLAKQMITEGLAFGPLPTDADSPNLERIFDDLTWSFQLWLVRHSDHRNTSAVQAVWSVLKELR